MPFSSGGRRTKVLRARKSGKHISRREPNPICLKPNISRTLLCFQPCHTTVCLRLQATPCTQNIQFQVLRSFKRINYSRDKKESGEMLTHFEHFCRRIGKNLSLKTILFSVSVCLSFWDTARCCVPKQFIVCFFQMFCFFFSFSLICVRAHLSTVCRDRRKSGLLNLIG